MAGLIIKRNSLENARAKFEKQSQRHKQFQISFERKQNAKGKFVTKANIVRGTKEYHYKKAGLLHSAVYGAKYRIKGDVPSLTKKINTFQPKSKKGKAFKAAAKGASFIAKDVGRTAVDIGLAAETLGLSSASLAGRSAVSSLKNITVRKYGQNASDDTNKAMLAGGKLIISGALGAKNHFKSKKRYKLERAKFKLQKAELKEFKESTFKPQLKSNKADLKTAKEKLKASKKSYKISSKSKVRKARLDLKKVRFAQQKKEIKLERKQLKSQKKFMAKEMRNQWRLQDLTRPTPLILKPLSSGSKGLTASAYQKALTADERNDVMRALDKSGRIAKSAASKAFGKNSSLQRRQKKSDKLQNRSGKKQTKLQVNENRLKNKSSILNQKWKSKRKAQKNSAENAKKSGKAVLRVLAAPAKFLAAHLTLTLIFIIFVMLILIIFNGTIEAIFGNSGWVMGTYTSQDKYLSQAEEYYTKRAYDMNNKILKVGSEDDWKKGLKEFGVDTSNMKDNPDTWIWGKSTKFNYDPVYDFDTFKLWSYLCAYYFDFTNSSDKDNGTEAKYWEYNSNEDSGTAKVIKDLFNSEYKFEYWYDNTSRWEEYETYTFEGGIDGSYWLVDSNESYKDKFLPKSNPGVLNEYKDDDGYIHFNNSLEIINVNDDNERTGWFIQDQRYKVIDSMGNCSDPFYAWYDNREFGREYNGEYHARSYWGWSDDDQCYWLVSPDDTLRWRDDLTDTCLVSYYQRNYWKTDCRLYYNVKQKKTLDKAIKDKLTNMSHGSERYKMYEMFLGTAEDSETTRGNHQEFAFPLGGSIQDYIDVGKIINGYGYDVQGWNTTHCEVAADGDTHQAIDIACTSGSKIYAGLDGEIKEINTDKDYIVIRDDDYKYWYDGDGSGKNRDTEITYYNVSPKSNLNEGDTVKKGEYIGLSMPQKKCEDLENNSASDYYIHIKIEIDSDGWGWDFIDPCLVFE